MGISEIDGATVRFINDVTYAGTGRIGVGRNGRDGIDIIRTQKVYIGRIGLIVMEVSAKTRTVMATTASLSLPGPPNMTVLSQPIRAEISDGKSTVRRLPMTRDTATRIGRYRRDAVAIQAADANPALQVGPMA